MSKTKNAIELHLKSLATLQEINLLEIELKAAENVKDSMSTFGHETPDSYFDTTDQLKEAIEIKRRYFMKGSELTQNLMSNE